MKFYKIRKKLPIIVYAGSCIQQNHGEDLNGHGYVIWNLKQRIFKQFNLENDYGFFTVDIKHGKLNTDISNIPKKVRLRVRCFESVTSEVKLVVSDIREKTDINEITYVRVDGDDISHKSSLTIKDLNLADLSDVDYQNTLIKDFLTRKSLHGSISDQMYERIFEINKKYNLTIDKDKTVRNIRWKPKKFEFRNMFSYGEGNEIDFSKMKDVVGLFALNAAGKSSILSALSFCIFDKCDRAFKASHVLNSSKMSFQCKFNFEINNVDYFIERIGTSDKKGNVKVSVQFWKDENGKKVELNGEARRSTNDLIRDHLGSYDDFILTVLSIQNNRSGTFVDMGQTERKDLLSQFMGLNIFDELFQKSSERLKELAAEIKSFHISDDGKNSVNMAYDLTILKKSCDNIHSELEVLTADRESLNVKLLNETRKLITLEVGIPAEITSSVDRKSELEEEIESINKDLLVYNGELISFSEELSEQRDELDKFLKNEIVKNHEKFKHLNKESLRVKNLIDRKKLVVSSKLEKLEKLEKHEYDPNCKFCINNEFVKDAIEVKGTLELDKNETVLLVDEYKKVSDELNDLHHIEKDFSSYEDVLKNISKLEKQISNKKNDILRLSAESVSNKHELKEVISNIDSYCQHKDSIENNTHVEKNLLNITSNIKSHESILKSKTTEHTNLIAKISILEKDISEKDRVEKLVKEMEIEYASYEHYISAISRDGIPFELITKAVPILEKEVNLILSQIVEFGVSIRADGKNVMTDIVYSDKKWPLELASGLEKFLCSLVIRVALINISNLPRPNFMAIDEGFGCADADNLASMNSLLSILKNNFDFMLVISHLDSMKDMVDNTIEIKKENGFSKIVY